MPGNSGDALRRKEFVSELRQRPSGAAARDGDAPRAWLIGAWLMGLRSESIGLIGLPFVVVHLPSVSAYYVPVHLSISLLSLGSGALFLVAGGVFMVSELVSEYRAARR